ncbi:MAG: hypothetical protein HRU18_01565 [Pseudoalteromonas sp.]|uniref:hypothetical protein n=1 Tax=Pseudoalteromonas sp. TaxID=53249 RepID=UPI001D3E676B|nr:hypothetical protein [Pseudoalteromonas sp.]NRA76869.1 hypothetical protein [Pseudoalteromonas sp.]
MGSKRNRKNSTPDSLKGNALYEGKVPQPKMSIKASIIDGNSKAVAEKVDKSDEQMLAEKKQYASKKEERKNIGWVISRLDEPKDIEYDGQMMRISPRSKRKIADHTKLGKLPTGIVCKK